MSIKLSINGKEKELETEISITDFLKKENIRSEIITIELNNSIVKKERYNEVFLNNNDRLEIVFFMAGGSQ